MLLLLGLTLELLATLEDESADELLTTLLEDDATDEELLGWPSLEDEISISDIESEDGKSDTGKPSTSAFVQEKTKVMASKMDATKRKWLIFIVNLTTLITRDNIEKITSKSNFQK
jgi:hypothetical protein